MNMKAWTMQKHACCHSRLTPLLCHGLAMPYGGCSADCRVPRLVWGVRMWMWPAPSAVRNPSAADCLDACPKLRVRSRATTARDLESVDTSGLWSSGAHLPLDTTHWTLRRGTGEYK